MSLKDKGKTWVHENRENLVYGAGQAAGFAVSYGMNKVGRAANMVGMVHIGVPLVFASTLAGKAITTYTDNVRHRIFL